MVAGPQSRKRQMAIYDRLGPLARAAVMRSAKDFDVVALWQKFDRPTVYGRELRHPDFQEPSFDAMVAAFVDKTVVDNFGLSFHGPPTEKPARFALDSRHGRRDIDAVVARAYGRLTPKYKAASDREACGRRQGSAGLATMAG